MSQPKESILKQLLENRIKFATVSGIFTTKPNLIQWVDQHIPHIELITTKSYQVEPNQGNREPIIVEPAIGCIGNAVGLRNPGMEVAYKDLSKLRSRHALRSLLNISVSADSIEGFIRLVKKFEGIADILELNFSCPHAGAGYGASIGTDPKIVAEYMTEIRKATSALLFPKLTPNVDCIGDIALAAINSGANGIVAINTVGPVLYLEPHTGAPILYNPRGHKGGKSGEWIREIALEKVREIRTAIGEGIPVIGMGGVTIAEDARKMMDAGANVVGIGVVFARVPTPSRPEFVAALYEDVERGTNHAATYLSNERLAEYRPHTITKIIQPEDKLRILELDGTIEYEASQFVFIWIPHVGEKPFSIAKKDPLTFVIRERAYDAEKEKGLVTHALFQLKEGEELMIRGVYGADAPDSAKRRAYVVAGGTGIAVVPALVEKLSGQGKNVTVYYGITSEKQIIFTTEISKYAKYIPVIDNGVQGRVLQELEADLAGQDLADCCFYNIGPVPLMGRAMEIQSNLGASSSDIFASLETNNLCGIGICGECECGGQPTCQDGTFLSRSYLMDHDINILEAEH